MNNHNANVFSALHRQSNRCLVLDNVWDAASAALLEAAGAKAIATSSAAVSWSLGYPDGNQVPIASHLSAINGICRAVKVPVSVDIEEGYSDNPEQVVDLVKRLVDIKVAGINIEDGANGVERLIEKLASIRAEIPSESLFINARCDVYLQKLTTPEKAETETIERLKRYVEMGADGVFVPGLDDTAVIARLAKAITVPLNVMSGLSGEQLQVLQKCGVARVSRGPGTFLSAYSHLVSARTTELGFADVDNLFTPA